MLASSNCSSTDLHEVDIASYEAHLGASEVTLHDQHHSRTPPLAVESKLPANEHRQLSLSEYDAVCHIRIQPYDKTSIAIVFGPQDLDSPRNWSKARKWYITCLVSMLNVLT